MTDGDKPDVSLRVLELVKKRLEEVGVHIYTEKGELAGLGPATEYERQQILERFRTKTINGPRRGTDEPLVSFLSSFACINSSTNIYDLFIN